MTDRLLVARTCLAVFVIGFVSLTVTVATGGASSSQQLIAIAFLAYAAVGYVLATRRPENPIGWLLLAGVTIGGVFLLCQALADWITSAGSDSELLAFLAYWPQNWMWLPLVSLTTTLPVLLFPTGRLLSARWRWVVWLTVGAAAVFAVTNAVALYIGSSQDGTRRINPLAPAFMRQFGDPADWPLNNALFVVMALTLLVALASLVVRWRRSAAVERLQLRWLLLGASGLAAGVVLNFAVTAPWGNLLLTVGFTALPACLGIAVLRYRLYDLDRVVSRTVSYVIVTGAALGLYALVVTSATALLPDSASAFAVAAATLAAAAVVRPLLSRVRHVVDRRFDRARFDAAATVDAFGVRLQDQLDPDATAHELVDVVRSTLGPRGVALHLAAGTVER